jgi:shikimate kinase
MPFFNDNWQLLNKIGTTFFLSHSLEQLLENISKSKVPRPLFNENNFRQLYKDRLPLYQQSSFTINCENLHQTQIARKIIKLYKS